MKLRLFFKLIFKRFFLFNEFCKACGRNVIGFYADDFLWRKVERFIKHGNVLCFDCFAKLCRKLKIEIKIIEDKLAK